MKKRILVCGSTGFLGRNFLNRIINKNYKVRAVFHKTLPMNKEYSDVEYVKADLTNLHDIQNILKDVDIVIQLAAQNACGVKEGLEKPWLSVTDNAIMNSLLLREVFKRKIERFIFPSCTVMCQSSDIPLKEEDFNVGDEPRPEYFGQAWTKVYIEKMCEFYSRLPENKTKYTVFRHSNIYGPHDKFDLINSHMCAAIIAKIMTNADGRIVVWGNGQEKRDLLYVDDLMDFLELVIEKQKEDFLFINVGSGRAIPVQAVVSTAIKASKKNLKVENDLTKPTVPTSLALDYSKATKIFGWKPKTSLSKGLLMTIKWYHENIE